MADKLFDTTMMGPNIEDIHTMVTSLSSASPADQERFLKSIKDTPTEAALNTVVEFMKLPADQKATFGNPPEAKADEPKK